MRATLHFDESRFNLSLNYLQNVCESAMMGVMLTLAVEWMQMGLPLQLFKIVVYSRCPNDPSEMEQDCVQVFKKMKNKIEEHRAKSVPRVCKSSLLTTTAYW